MPPLRPRVALPERVTMATHFVTVTLHHAPTAWLLSREQVISIEVRCVLTNVWTGLRVDLAEPLSPLPEEVQKRSKHRTEFLTALRLAIETSLSSPVLKIPYDRVAWTV